MHRCGQQGTVGHGGAHWGTVTHTAAHKGTAGHPISNQDLRLGPGWVPVLLNA